MRFQQTRREFIAAAGGAAAAAFVMGGISRAAAHEDLAAFTATYPTVDGAHLIAEWAWVDGRQRISGWRAGWRAGERYRVVIAGDELCVEDTLGLVAERLSLGDCGSLHGRDALRRYVGDAGAEEIQSAIQFGRV